MTPILGIIASGISGHLTPPFDPGAYYSLGTVTTSSTVASLTFAGIPTGYRSLQLRGIARTSAAGNNYSMVMACNGDTTVANYYSHAMFGIGSGAGQAAVYQSEGGMYITNAVAGAGAGTNVFASFVIDLIDYDSTTKNKVAKSIQGQDRNGSGITQVGGAGWYNNTTSPISSLTFTVAGGDFVANSSIALYGVL
jgi:hypothetical protein